MEHLTQPCVFVQTIIECLKQATTGELPPNTRSGQSFIHDPKASHHFHCLYQPHQNAKEAIIQVANMQWYRGMLA